MTLEEAYKLAERKSEEWWNQKAATDVCRDKTEFYKCMMQDLKAIGRTDEQIWHEFITGAFICGFFEAIKDQIVFDEVT